MSVTDKNVLQLLIQNRQSTRARAGSVITGLARIAKLLDRCIGISGRLSSWLCLLLALMVAGDVLARYIWHVGSVAEQELEWHVLAVIAMMGASYTLQQGEHVRVDIFYQYYSERLKQWLDVLIPLLIIVPTAIFIAYVSLRFVQMSYNLHEGSPDPGGLPARYLLKAFIPFGFGLVGIQGVAMFLDGLVKLLQSRQT
ncbi:MAG: TRAP transporter small permease subunit [Gammaproteobacteria bacterium]|jgi:TRAP-type mannitol/chloroaromatic compound transport system permease small subunit